MPEFTLEEDLERRMKLWNETPGDLKGYDCPECKNRGFSYKSTGESIVSVNCRCKVIRDTISELRRSGLYDMAQEFTFDRFRTETKLQRQMKSGAKTYIESPGDRWFFIGGQVGAGKTHICTATVNELIHKGKSARYVIWRELIKKAETMRFNDEGYYNFMHPLETIDVLYVDDLFKQSKSHPMSPTQMSNAFSITFDLLNRRYLSHLNTIISSEFDYDQLEDMDAGLATRIYERSKAIEGHPSYSFSIPWKDEFNYRLKESQ